MSADPHPMVTPPQPSAAVLVGAWAGVLALGGLATGRFIVFSHKFWPPTESDGLLAIPATWIAAVEIGLPASVVLATAAAVWVGLARTPGDRLGRRLAVAAAGVLLVGVGLWVAGRVLDHVRHGRAAAAIVGTWRVETVDGTALEEVTFRPDGRAVATSLTGPPNERKPHTSGYQVARDGLHVRTFDLPEPPGAGEWWEHLEFYDPDTFRIWVKSFNEQGGYWYRRVR